MGIALTLASGAAIQVALLLAFARSAETAVLIVLGVALAM